MSIERNKWAHQCKWWKYQLLGGTTLKILIWASKRLQGFLTKCVCQHKFLNFMLSNAQTRGEIFYTSCIWFHILLIICPILSFNIFYVCKHIASLPSLILDSWSCLWLWSGWVLKLKVSFGNQCLGFTYYANEDIWESLMGNSWDSAIPCPLSVRINVAK